MNSKKSEEALRVFRETEFAVHLSSLKAQKFWLPAMLCWFKTRTKSCILLTNNKSTVVNF